MKKKTDNKSCFDYAGAVDLSRALSSLLNFVFLVERIVLID